MTTPSSYINPFGIPGAERLPVAPLRPWHTDTHSHRYADVDHAAQAFSGFQNQFGAAGDVSGVGRLVLVYGETGCGKSSIMHRCAHWVERGMPPGKARVCDLSGETTSGPETRMRQLGERLVDKIGGLGLLSQQRLADLREIRSTDLGQILPLVSDSLAADTALILILPPMTHMGEMKHLWNAVRPKIAVLVESPGLDLADRCDQELSSDLTMLIRLGVGPLGAGDARIFAEQRITGPLALGRRGVDFPDLDLDDVDGLVTRRQEDSKITIKFLQSTLHQLYEEFRTDPWPANGIVTYHELTDFIVRKFRGLH